MSSLQISTFKIDVTCPVGYPLCGGWKSPAIAIADPLYALGVVLKGNDKPVVLCVIDWCEISNKTYLQWCERLAEAAGTDADHVALHTMHPHCTPWPDIEAQQLIDKQQNLRSMMDVAWIDQILDKLCNAVSQAAKHFQPFTHIQTGRAEVKQVASNRRIMDHDNKIKAVRWCATRDPAVRAEPEGLIDPYLKTLSFWHQDKKIAAIHYYAVHPTSYDNDQTITVDFTGLAREQRNQDEPNTLHLYFTECAGNITAGKYNDGSPANRPVLSKRIYDAMIQAEQSPKRIAVDEFSWKVQNVFLPPRADQTQAELNQVLGDESQSEVTRIRAAIRLAGLHRQDKPITLTSLNFGHDVCIVHLPGESFIEYQLFTQAQSRADFVAVPSYGDCGPGYICMQESAAQGGYEPTDSFVAPQAEAIMRDAIIALT